MSDKHTVASRGKGKGRDNDAGSVNNTSGGNFEGGGLFPYYTRSLRRVSQAPLKGHVRPASPVTSFLNQIALSEQGELHLRTQTVQAIQDKAQHKGSKAYNLREPVHIESSQCHTQNLRRSATADPSSSLRIGPNLSSTQHSEHRTVQGQGDKAYDTLEPLNNDPIYNDTFEPLDNDPIYNDTLEPLDNSTLEPVYEESTQNHTQNEWLSTAAVSSSSLGIGSFPSFSQHPEYEKPSEFLPLLPLRPLTPPSSLLQLPALVPDQGISLNKPKRLESFLDIMPSAQAGITYVDAGTQTGPMDPASKISPIRLAILQEEEAVAQFRHVGIMTRRKEFLAVELRHKRNLLELRRYAIFHEAQRVVAPAGAAPGIGQGRPNAEVPREPINRVEPHEQINGRESRLGDEDQANEARGEEDQRGEDLAINHANKESGAGSRSSTSHAHGKHLTCYFWHHGQCRKSAAECSYAHHDTGIVATSPEENRKRKRGHADHEHDDRYHHPGHGYRRDDGYYE